MNNKIKKLIVTVVFLGVVVLAGIKVIPELDKQVYNKTYDEASYMVKSQNWMRAEVKEIIPCVYVVDYRKFDGLETDGTFNLTVRFIDKKMLSTVNVLWQD